MPSLMLDTNICIYVMKGALPALEETFERYSNDICISAVAFAELSYGVEKSARRDANRNVLAHFVARLEVLPFDANAASHFGQIRAILERAGTPVGHVDLLIGAHARSHDLTLVTNNRREFDRIPGLRVENWV